MLADGETLSEFVEASVRAGVECRRVQAEFIARGVRSRDETRRRDEYAEADLDRLFDFVLDRDRARYDGELTLPEQAIAALRAGIATLKTSPSTCRKAGQSPFLRELIVPFGHSGHVAPFEIENESNVAVVAVRNQLEDDCH